MLFETHLREAKSPAPETRHPAPDTMSIEFKNVTKTFGGTPVVDDLSLTIHDGEFVVLLGPSGCGKSTTLRMLAGLEEVTSGDIFINHERVNSVPPQHRDLAMV